MKNKKWGTARCFCNKYWKDFQLKLVIGKRNTAGLASLTNISKVYVSLAGGSSFLRHMFILCMLGLVRSLSFRKCPFQKVCRIKLSPLLQSLEKKLYNPIKVDLKSNSVMFCKTQLFILGWILKENVESYFC